MSFELTPRQNEAIDLARGPATHLMLYGGSRSGKTFIHLRNIAMRALRAPGSRHAVLRFRFNHLKASVILDTWPKMMALAFPGVPHELDRSDWYATLPGNAQVWFGGLDDKDRVEKVLGQEHATIFLNECSQISYEARNTALTRLAQNVVDLHGKPLPLRMYYDCNPPSNAHWSYRLFAEGREPETREPLQDREDYAWLQMNPQHNADNLPASYIRTLESLPGRHRRRFLEGEFADANPNALFAQEWIDRWRVLDGSVPDWQRIVIAVDPSGASDADNAMNDEIGIAVCALGTDGRGYLLEDLTLKAGPGTWGAAAVSAYERHQADAIVAEANFGGAMVEHVIRTASRGKRIPYKAVKASRGKAIRAEPISSLYEEGKIRHVGNFASLEDELCAFTTFGYTGEGSPNRADAAIWGFSEIFPGMVSERKAPKPRRARREIPRGPGAWMGA